MNTQQSLDIVILSPSEWSDNAVSNMQIAAILSETNNVLYVETMGGRLPKWSELGRVWNRLKRAFSGIDHKKKERGLDPRNVSILSPLALPIHGRRFFDWLNKYMLLIQIRRRMRHLNISRPVLWVFSPRWESVINALDKSLAVFHCVDGLHTYDASNVFKEQLNRTTSQSDIVFTPGKLLEKELKVLNARTYRIGHGCGQEHINYNLKGLEVGELENIPSPWAIYAGTLANWVDYPLLIKAAKILTKVSFVLIGYVHALTPKDHIKTLKELPNVYMLGYKNFDQLPRYYTRADVGIIPYQSSNEHIRYSIPTKIMDYFAAGLPAVSTRYPAAEDMTPWVSCADTPEEFSEMIRDAMQKKSESEVLARKKYASEHTWDKQVRKMLLPIREHLELSKL